MGRIVIDYFSLFKITIAMSFPSAIVVHYLIPLIVWFKNQDLLIVALALTSYYAGFTLGTHYGLWSRATLSRMAGTFMTAHVITTLLLGAYGYGYMAPIFSMLVGATTGGLLSLPSSKVMSIPTASLLSAFPLFGSILMEFYGADSVLVASGMLAFLSSVLLLISMKIIVPKPKMVEDGKLGLSLDGWLIALGIGLGGTMGTVLMPVIAVVALEVEVIYVGLIITISLVTIQVIALRLRKQNVIYKSIGTITALSIFFVFLIMGLQDNIFIFLVLWFLAIVDLSYCNSFLVVANRTLKKFDEKIFMLVSNILCMFGPLLAVLIWAMGSYQLIFYFSAFLILIGWIAMRRFLKEVK
ncbi:MAG: hypothetical protein N3D12_02275 [Candidatus Methanomethyliaceae archaeon]|nr:hypothetical protein [Candidatus Methanomethyliaceae archaeon]